MKHRNRIYHLLVNEQQYILELLKVMDVKNPKEKIKNILDEQLFEILECSENTILKIKKKDTGEIFEKGCKFYHKKYDSWIENMYFDESLFGVYSGETFYKNYVRGNGGLYHLDQISLTDKKDETSTIQKEIVLNGITYVVKE
jgi:hypothetical protein